MIPIDEPITENLNAFTHREEFINISVAYPRFNQRERSFALQRFWDEYRRLYENKRITEANRSKDG